MIRMPLIELDALWLAVQPIDMRAGTDRLLASVVRVFGAAQAHHGWAYDVEIVAGTKVFDVRVNADSGTVISSVEDQGDRDDDNDKKD